MVIPLSQWKSVKSYVINQQSVKTGWNSATWWKCSPKVPSLFVRQACFELRPGWRRWGSFRWWRLINQRMKVPYAPWPWYIKTIKNLQNWVNILLKGKCRDSYTSTMVRICGSSPSSAAQFQERRNREAMAEHQPRWLQPAKIGWCPIPWWKWHRDIPQKKSWKCWENIWILQLYPL